ncbi:tRNA threonylcarbamoyladenosine biosynthesis protein TsaE [Mycoplasmopsis agalactiae]|uniref:tRNA (adenosine(37)-N6)-threonylcarbamoyltransferase complex ATPase subunit type 1 TsaE n=1 Tax=Mycoplasmopsis agalactiae TaxID=2110 RepID=UPI000C702835|nr:tRNA (adenosine(37)-N6)-threonylcarbamoyltransferase complex ATPase subunit type 1 TsaE [Mycoplasmopsis agalactiae]SBO45291.1 tRNA threonylcarbamoyladenosine biosynthesis protein TsaE [Mycoplasmopsis agalactiae]
MQPSKIFVTKENQSLTEVANYVLNNLTKSKLLLLNGELGAGKTTLLKEIAKIIGIKEPITSPTFNYMKTYNGLVHIDAYYLSGEIDEFIDYADENDIIAIEWPSKIIHYYSNYVSVDIVLDEKNNHIFTIKVVE